MMRLFWNSGCIPNSDIERHVIELKTGVSDIKKITVVLELGNCIIIMH